MASCKGLPDPQHSGSASSMLCYAAYASCAAPVLLVLPNRSLQMAAVFPCWEWQILSNLQGRTDLSKRLKSPPLRLSVRLQGSLGSL
jgi:hypothetical protein